MWFWASAVQGRSVSCSNEKQVRKPFLGIVARLTSQPPRQEGHVRYRPENFAPELWPQSPFRK